MSIEWTRAGYVFALAVFTTGLYAAWLWFKASKVPVRPPWLPLDEPTDPNRQNTGWIVGTLAAFDEAADLNKRAALWTAVTAMLTALQSLAGLLASLVP